MCVPSKGRRHPWEVAPLLLRTGAAARRHLRAALRGRGAVVFLVLGIVALLPVALVPGAERDRLATSLLLLGLGLGVLHLFPRHRFAALAIAIVASVRYLSWRATATLPTDTWPDAVLGFLLFATELFGFLVMLGGSFQTVVRRERKPVPLDCFDPATHPHVDVFVPTYDEGADILRRTLTGATRIAYPNKTVHVLDDGRRPEIEVLAAEMGCTYHTRPDNEGAKAGNLNHALARTSGELVAIFDADHVPVRSFLDATVGFFLADPNVALVQTPHHFYNPDPFERNLRLAGRVPPEQAFFYHTVQKGNDFWNAAFFCGSCAVLRRDALLSVGGIAQETVTEDAHTAMRIHGRGWRSVYLDMPLAAGLATERFAWHVAQRARWTRGMIQILRLDSPLSARGLSLPQRLCYLVAASHFLYGIPRLVYLTAPATYLLLGLHPISADAANLAIFALPHLVLAAAASATSNTNTRHSFWPEVYETAMAPWAAAVALVTWLSPRRGKFNVTPKGSPVGKAHVDFGRAAPLLGLLAIAVAAGLAAPLRLQAEPEAWDDLALASAWNLWNLVLLLAATVVCLEPPERRRTPRLAARGALLALDPGELAPRASGDLVEISETGARARFPMGTVLPTELDVIVRTGADAETRLGHVRVMDAHVGPGGTTEVGFQFPELDNDTKLALLAHMFVAPDTWLQDRFAADHPIRAWLGVLVAPWRVTLAFLRGKPVPAPVSAGRPVGSWVVGACECGRPAFPGAVRCVSCGAAVSVAPPVRPAVVRRRFAAVAAAIPIAAGLLLAIRPVAAAVDDDPRAGVLAAAHEEILSLRFEARLLALTGDRPTARFEKRIWALGYVLDRPDSGSPGEEPLRDALGALRATSAALASGASEDDLSVSLDALDAALDRVGADQPSIAWRTP